MQIGTPDAVLHSTRNIFDPQFGRQWEFEYHGSEFAVKAVAQGFATAGIHAQTFNRANMWIALIRVQSQEQIDGTPEEPSTRYEITTEVVQESAWGNPNVIQAFGSELAQTRKEVEDAVEEGESESETGFSGDKLTMFRDISRGANAYETERKVLSRVRTYSADFAGASTLQFVPIVYTTTALVRDFAIPGGIAVRLPSNPAFAPQDRVWAWKRRRDHSVFIVSQNKVEEITDWVFAAWSTLYYQVIT